MTKILKTFGYQCRKCGYEYTGQAVSKMGAKHCPKCGDLNKSIREEQVIEK